jgi:pilus assembly protein TadC
MNPLPLISAAFVFSAVFLLSRTALSAVARRASEGRGIAGQFDYIRETGRLPGLFRLQELSRVFLPLAEYLVRANRFRMREQARTLDLLLVRAGVRPYILPQALISVAFLTAFIGGAMMSLAALGLGFGPAAAVFGFISGGLAGYALPQFQLGQLVRSRIALIEKRLPFAIEFMLLSMEASAAFPTAVEVYCEQFDDDPLAEELRMTLSDIDRGVGLQDAFNNFERRVGSEHVSAFVLAITIGIETGQPVKDILETQATAARQKRYESAEVIAKKASTNALPPLFLIVVAILLLLMGPIIVNFTRSSLF